MPGGYRALQVDPFHTWDQYRLDMLPSDETRHDVKDIVTELMFDWGFQKSRMSNFISKQKGVPYLGGPELDEILIEHRKWALERRRHHLENYPVHIVEKAYRLFERFTLGV